MKKKIFFEEKYHKSSKCSIGGPIDNIGISKLKESYFSTFAM